MIRGTECPYALSPDLTGLQAGDGNGVGVGQRDGESSSCHMSVHWTAADS